MRGKKRSPEERVSCLAGQLPPCRVCGEQAAGFHYGVNTCEACKGFFRRSLVRDGKYECIGEGNCVINTNRRKSCPKCRYLKCLEVGMSKDAIKTGRYTYTKRTQDTLELKLLAQANQIETSSINLDNNNSTKTLDESTSNSLQYKLHDIVKNELKYPNQSPSRPSIVVSDFSNVLAPSSSVYSISSNIQPKTEPSSNLSPQLLYQTSCASNHDVNTITSNEKLITIEELQEEKPTQDLKTLTQSVVVSDIKAKSPMSSSLLSPISMTDSCESSPKSQKLLHLDPSSSKTFLSSSEASPMSYYSPLSSPMPNVPSHQACIETGSQNWPVYSESELDLFISDIVTNHKMYVEDSNSISDDVLQNMYQECKERCTLQTEIFGHMGTIKRDEHDQIYASTGLDVDGRLDDLSYAAEKMDIYIKQMISFMKLIPGFRTLCLPDQIALVKASIYDVFLLGYFRGYNKEEYIVVEPSRSYCKHQMEIFQSQEDLDKVFNMSQKLQNLNLTFEMVIILKALCVLFSDRAILEEPDNIEKIQCKMVQSLLLLLKRHFSDNFGLMFGKIISVLTQSRNYAEDCRKFIMTNMFTGTYMERFHSVPILVELFSANVSS